VTAAPVLLPWQGANIGRRVPDGKAAANIARMRTMPAALAPPNALRRPGCAWQEVNDDNPRVDERDHINDEFPRPSWTTWPRFDHRPGALVPVTIPAPWAMEDQWTRQISDGRAHVQPDRFLTVRVMRHPLLAAPMAFLSWQQVQGAFTDPGQRDEAYRKASWPAQFHRVKVEARALVKDDITVAYAADTNRPGCPLLLWDDHRVKQQGLDALGYIEGRGRHHVHVRVRRTWRVPLNIDGHDGTGALLALTC